MRGRDPSTGPRPHGDLSAPRSVPAAVGGGRRDHQVVEDADEGFVAREGRRYRLNVPAETL
jgi:hypothetical protein